MLNNMVNNIPARGTVTFMAPLLEDVMIAERAKARLVEQFTPVSGDELVARLGLEEADISAETAALLATMNIAA